MDGATLLYLLVTVLFFATAAVFLTILAREARPGTIAIGLALPALLLPLLSYALDAGGFRSLPPEPTDRVGYYVTVLAGLLVGAGFLSGLAASAMIARSRG